MYHKPHLKNIEISYFTPGTLSKNTTHFEKAVVNKFYKSIALLRILQNILPRTAIFTLLSVGRALSGQW